jgi:hypothetical protein
VATAQCRVLLLHRPAVSALVRPVQSVAATSARCICTRQPSAECCCYIGPLYLHSTAQCRVLLLHRPAVSALDSLEAHLDRVVAGVQMLQELRHDLTLGTRVLFAHGSIHQLRDVPVEVCNEVL